MFARNALVALVLAAASVFAQSVTSTAMTGTPSISTCIVGCVTKAASTAGCSSFTDLQCVCTNQTFQKDAQDCLKSCTSEEQQAALALQKAECAAISGTSSAASGSATSSGSASASVTASSSGSGSASGTSSSASTSGTGTGAVGSSISSAASSISSELSSQLSSAIGSQTTGTAPATSSPAASGAAGRVGATGVWQVALAAAGVVAGGALVL